MSERTARARQVALGSFVALVLVLAVEVLGIARLELATRVFLCVIWVGPLLVFLPGLLRGHWKTYLWLCFVILVYFMVAVSELFGPYRDAADVLELILIVTLFTASMLYGRWRQRELAGTGA